MESFIPGRSEWRTAFRYGIIILVFGFAVRNAEALATSVLPFALAFMTSLALDPVLAFLATKARLGRGWSALLLLVVIVLGGGLFLAWASTALVEQVAVFIDAFPEYKETVLRYVDEITRRATDAYLTLPPTVIQWINENTSRLANAAQQALTAGGLGVVGFFAALPGFVASSLLYLIATFFMSKDLPRVRAFLWRLVPEESQGKVRRVIVDLIGVAWKYLRAQGVLIGLTTVVITLGLWVIGVRNWLAAGLLIGLLDLLPVVGPILAFVPWAVYLLIVDQTRLAVSLLILYAVSSSVRSLFEAKVIGDSVGLHPLATLFAIYAGANIWGVVGVILGPAILLVAKAIYKAWRSVDPPAS